ncbi:MAG TPA: hypothetical protein VHE83_19660 [Mycobacteriales bacterium]|nr:hypothetical protein [Mycobacteriales bacterium]
MIDLTDPSATDVREVLSSHAHDIGAPRTDLASRAERRALALRRQRTVALIGGVGVIVAAAIAIPLSLSGASGARTNIDQLPPGSDFTHNIQSTTVPILANDPTTWPFRGDERMSQALRDPAKIAVNLLDRTAAYEVQPLWAGSAPYGDRILAFLAVPADPAKSVAFGVYQQPTSGSGFLIQPYDIGRHGQLDVLMLNLALRTGSIKYLTIIGAPSVYDFQIKVHDGSAGSAIQPCDTHDGVSVCPGADVTTDQVQLLGPQGRVIASEKVHYDQQD